MNTRVGYNKVLDSGNAFGFAAFLDACSSYWGSKKNKFIEHLRWKECRKIHFHFRLFLRGALGWSNHHGDWNLECYYPCAKDVLSSCCCFDISFVTIRCNSIRMKRKEEAENHVRSYYLWGCWEKLFPTSGKKFVWWIDSETYFG